MVRAVRPASVTSDNVLQDPKQYFDPFGGVSNKHQFDLFGTDCGDVGHMGLTLIIVDKR